MCCAVAGLVRGTAPGGNITGVSLFDSETYAKRLQILKDALPLGVQDRVPVAALGVGKCRWTSIAKSASGSGPAIGIVGDSDAAPRVDRA
jgi:hypothetical protein